MHNICYEWYLESKSRTDISNSVLNIVKHSGDGYGTDSIRYVDRIFDTKEDARKWIEENDNGFYEGIAVKFYDYSKVKDTKKIEELKQKLVEIYEKKQEYIKAHSVKNFKSQYIGCSCCGSKLNRQRLKSEYCPLCHTDLRAVSTLERIKNYDDRSAEISEKIIQENKNQKDKAVIKWLVKFEYHS